MSDEVKQPGTPLTEAEWHIVSMKLNKLHYEDNKARRRAHAARIAAKRIYAKRQRRGWYRWNE